LLISIPHVGTHISPALQEWMTPEALTVPDWHLEALYDFAATLGASVIAATHSRYVVDLNGPPDKENLYPGQNTTGLCPTDTFDEVPLYLDGQVPAQSEVLERREAYWRPYHQTLQAELLRLRQRHGAVALWDAHSIRSVVPHFFAGRLPDFNLGTASGASTSPVLADAVYAVAQRTSGFSAVLNGPFQGRLHHASIRPAGRTDPRHSTGDGSARLHGRCAAFPLRRRTRGRRAAGVARDARGGAGPRDWDTRDAR
jgi:N-formylglutamate deformylase